MTDIVERLRLPVSNPEDYVARHDPLRLEAADEIERLRAIADTDTPELLEQQAKIERLQSDNERLYINLKAVIARDDKQLEKLARLQAENARLADALMRLRDHEPVLVDAALATPQQ